MKITCPSCQSKYTIADEKVQGRGSVKVRCRKCGETIHVTADGATGSPGAPGDGAATAAAFSVLVAEGDQRDMTLPEVVSAYNSGLVTADTFVWGDGQADWMPLGQVTAIVDAIQQASEAVDREAKAAPEQPPMNDIASPSASPGLFADPLAAAPPAVAPPPADDALFAPPAASAASDHAAVKGRGHAVDLFGAHPGPAAGGDEEVATSAPAIGAVTTGGKAPGARDEQSVLFSLNALTSATPRGQGSGPGGGKDDSGLIDLKALATKAEETKKPDMMLGGVPILDAAPILGTPLMEATSETATPQKGSNKGLFIGAGIGIAGIAAACIVIAVVLTRKPVVVVAPPASVAAATTDTAPTPSATSTDSSAAAPATGAPSASAAKTPVKGGKGVPGGKSTGTAGGKSTGPEATATTPKKPPPNKCGCAPTDLACAMACAAK